MDIDEQGNDMTEINEKTLEQRVMDIPYWYHKIELPGGIVTPGWSPLYPEKYGIPDDLTGKRVLDIGAWDGFWTWEALKRGAKEVVAIDDFSDNCGNPDIVKRNGWETFDLCREAFGFDGRDGAAVVPDLNDLSGGYWYNENQQQLTRIQMSIYDINNLGQFDIVFFFGTIYHLKYPYLAMEKIASICTGEIYIESAICDDYSPYRGGLNKGYPNNDMVTEFYPTKEYGGNVNNWWVPTLQCLGAMTESVGFKNIHAWGLTTKPKGVPECRGFIYGSKTGAENIKCNSLISLESSQFKKQLNVAAVMSVPRLGFMDNYFCIFEGVVPHKIPIIKMQGAFWGQCLERGIQTQIDTGADAILTIDYDTIFSKEDVGNLLRLMVEHPEADAIVPLQIGRGSKKGLLSLKSKSGLLREWIPDTELQPELTKIYSGHFGLTLIRTSSLLKLPHPWFIDIPAHDGQWGSGRIDADINFWRKMEMEGMTVYSANHIVVGHLELVVTWPSKELNPVYQSVFDYQKLFLPPENVWK